MPPPASSPTLPPRLWREIIAVWAVLALFFEVGLNNINHQAYMGQDFYLHVNCTMNLLQHPGAWFAVDPTNRPLVYWLGGWCVRLGGTAPFMLASLSFVALNAGALWLLHDSSRWFIASPVLRVAALALVACLPATLIGSVVYAADAVAQLPFALLCWSLIRAAHAGRRRAVWGYAGLAGAALGLGQLAKFTFIVLPLAVVLLALILRRWQRVGREACLAMCLLAGLLPLLTGLGLHHASQQAVADQPVRHEFNWAGTGEMTWSSLLLVKRSDARIFSAPGYWDHTTVNGELVMTLLGNNDYSYPALLHLGIFTDVADFSRRLITGLEVPRPEPQRSYAQWAVRGGLLFFLPAVAALAALLGRIGWAVWRPIAAPPTGLFIWGALGMTWYLPLMLVLPFIHRAYDAGYWLPRLLLPALWSFGFVLYAAIDARAGHRRMVVAVVGLLTALQVWVQIGSVWY